MKIELRVGDCMEVLKGCGDESVDSCVTDPPYGLEFMGKDWDAPWESDPDIGKRWQGGMNKVEMGSVPSSGADSSVPSRVMARPAGGFLRVN